ncbi:MAG TPA: cellulase family glycosylhydrolase [Thermoleophilaceae bacterium]
MTAHGLTRRDLVRGGAIGAAAALAGVGLHLALRGAGSPAPVSPPLELIGVDARGTGFAGTVSGQQFTAWGFNWGGPGEYRDLGVVRKRFSEMRALGANTVRIHQQFADLTESPTEANEHELARLASIVEIAEQEGLYLDISGNEVWLPASAPAWYGQLDEASRWDAQATYWSAVARVCAGSPAVFCYDLLSEPLVGNGVPNGDWYTGKLGDFYFGQRISLELAGRRPDDVARAWVEHLTAAIRAEDKRHLITVGLLPDMHMSRFDADAVAPLLDFLAVHVYPQTGRAAESVALVERLAALGKPVLIEETYLLAGDVPTLERFVVGTRPYAAGWLGFYFPGPPGGPRSIQAALAQEWLRLFQSYTPTRRRQSDR